MFVVEHITIGPYHPRSNIQAERFAGPKKSNSVSTDAALQQFLQVYWLTPNKNGPSAMALQKLFARKL